MGGTYYFNIRAEKTRKAKFKVRALQGNQQSDGLSIRRYCKGKLLFRNSQIFVLLIKQFTNKKRPLQIFGKTL